MWSRVVEFMLGCWLAASPFIFGHPADDLSLWIMDWICAVLVISFSVLSYWTPLRHIHLATGLLALVMIAYGRLASPTDVIPALQNHIVVGLLLLMFALVPNQAGRPPRRWYGEPRAS